MHDDPDGGADPLGTAVARALEPVLGAVAVQDLRPMTGGASRETWSFDAVGPGGVRHGLVLRRDPPGRPSSPGAMEAEASAMRAARDAGVAVPEVLVVDGSPSSWGGAGMVMRRVEGEAVARRILRDDRFAVARMRLVAQCGAALAAIHSLAPADVLGAMPAGDQLSGLRAISTELGEPVPTFDWAFARLEEDRPATAGPVVLHGDFRLGNLLVDDEGLAAVLDWELVHPGDPLEDLGWLCARPWRFGASGPVAGLGAREELIAAYEGAGGAPVDPEALAWWEAYATLRWGVICLTQAAVHLRGDLRSVELAAIGRRVAEAEWDLLLLLAPDAARAARDAATRDEPDGHRPGLHGRPDVVDLVEALGGFLDDRVRHAEDPGLAFGARVAANVAAVVARELRLGPDQQRRRDEALGELGLASEEELASAIRAGDDLGVTADRLVGVLAEGVVDRLLVANPRYLDAPD